MSPGELAARVKAAHELSALARHIAADLFAITLKAGGLLNGAPIGSTVGSLWRHEGERRSFAKQIGRIADSLDLYCATPKKIRGDADSLFRLRPSHPCAHLLLPQRGRNM